ncbi:hypothetical protein LOAG_07345 [Loa loa]|uniref:Uncharacterized protein n=1 Tax=Loa loa TaxID=7209 RepID=A0A1S0TW79_LOALO|nr:hypothetical protein LOAG_07345 [Loa loa]EFO21142.1 hypothetical protein LOAG_07345 [Loa loa]
MSYVRQVKTHFFANVHGYTFQAHVARCCKSAHVDYQVRGQCRRILKDLRPPSAHSKEPQTILLGERKIANQTAERTGTGISKRGNTQSSNIIKEASGMQSDLRMHECEHNDRVL